MHNKVTIERSLQKEQLKVRISCEHMPRSLGQFVTAWSASALSHILIPICINVNKTGEMPRVCLTKKLKDKALHRGEKKISNMTIFKNCIDEKDKPVCSDKHE